MPDRRDPTRQQPKVGGKRGGDPTPSEPPYRVGECARWMGVTTDYIRGAIIEGVWSPRLERMIQLEAEFLPGPDAESRGEYRIFHDAFIRFLTDIGWSRVPARR